MIANANVYPVYVTVTNEGGQPAMSVAPDTVTINATDRNVAIVFAVVDQTTNGGPAQWRFPTTRSPAGGNDEFYGISIQGDSGQQFGAAQRDPSGLFVTIIDNNTNSETYTYSVQLTDGTRTLGVDPTIKNQGN